MLDWPRYIQETKNKPPRKLLLRAVDYVRVLNSALDLGAGALNESKYLLSRGFKEVLAVDLIKDDDLLKEIRAANFYFENTSLEEYGFSINRFDLVNAQYVLPFIAKQRLNKLLFDIRRSLKIGGIFLGQFFGVRDSWQNENGVFVYSKREIENFLGDYEKNYFEEEEKDGQTVVGVAKHWHIFHFIVRRS